MQLPNFAKIRECARNNTVVEGGKCEEQEEGNVWCQKKKKGRNLKYFETEVARKMGKRVNENKGVGFLGGMWRGK